MNRKPFALWVPERQRWEAVKGTTLWILKPGGKWEELGRITRSIATAREAAVDHRHHSSVLRAVAGAS